MVSESAPRSKKLLSRPTLEILSNCSKTCAIFISVSSYFHLVIISTEAFNGSVWSPTTQVTGFVQTCTSVMSEWTVYKPLGSEIGATPIAFRNPLPTDEEFSWYSDWDWLQTTIQ